MRNLIAKVVVGVIVFAATALPTFAVPFHPPFGNQVTIGSVPTGSKMIMKTSYKVTNDEDAGNLGYWALDNYKTNIQVWQVPDGSYYVVADYKGTWQTFAGSISPNAGVTENNDASGTFDGGYTAVFTAASCSTVKGNSGSFDFGGTKEDILLGSYRIGQKGPPTPYDFFAQYCPGYSNFDFSYWGWNYNYNNQTYSDTNTGRTNDIVVP